MGSSDSEGEVLPPEAGGEDFLRQAQAAGEGARQLAERLQAQGLARDAIGSGLLGFALHVCVQGLGRAATAAWLRDAADALEAPAERRLHS